MDTHHNSLLTPGNHDYFNYRNVILWSTLIAIGVGLLWMTFVHCMPKMAPIAAFVLAILGLIALAVLFIVLPD